MSSSAMEDAPAAAAAAVVPSAEDDEQTQEEMRRMEEYKIWKKNAPFLYDCLVSHSLEWPSLTVQWLPDRLLPEGKDYSVQRLLLGTHTSADDSAAASASSAAGSSAAAAAQAAPPPNYLLIAEVRLPRGDVPASRGSTAKGGSAAAASGAAAGDESDDEGAYGKQQGKIDILQRILHKGEVHRARYNPHNPDLIATKSPFAPVCIFDRSRHSLRPAIGDTTPRPDLVLMGHEQEGYGLAWNPHAAHQGWLLSGSNDGRVCLWDVGEQKREKKRPDAASNGAHAPPTLQPLHNLHTHTDVVGDVCWSMFAPSVFASCGDDKRLLLWDMRSRAETTGKDLATPVVTLNDASKARLSSNAASAGGAAPGSAGHHTSNINGVSFNHFSEFILASAGSDGVVLLWDLRSPHAPLHALRAHSLAHAPPDPIEFENLQFSPFSQDILAVTDKRRRAYVFDLSRIGSELEDASAAAAMDADADGGGDWDASDSAPPELLFVHGGHTDHIADLGWNPSREDEWMCATVADDNVLHVWQISESVYEQEDRTHAHGAAQHAHVDLSED